MSATAPALPPSLVTTPLLSRWLRITPDGRVIVSTGKVEIGQGILTALAQVAADELDVDVGRVAVRAVTTPSSPDEGVTSGSLSVQHSGGAIRHVCAEARAIMLGVIAQRSGVALEALRVEDGTVLGPAGAVGTYWDLAERGLLEADATPGKRAKAPAARRVAGASVARVDLPDKVFGAARYIHDLCPPGLLHARVVRPPSRGGRLLAVPDFVLPEGASVVRDGSFLAVVARHEYEADRLATRLAARAAWEERDTLPDEGALPEWLRSADGKDEVCVERGAPAATDRRVRAAFFRPPVAHASIGPCCALARFRDGALEVWSHTQGPFNLRGELAKALRMPVESVTVHHAEGAGCYGHNGADDVALDAALCARAVPGRPVRVLWTRAEELGWAPYSPAMLVEVDASLDDAGDIASFSVGVTGNGHSSRPGRGPVPALLSASYLAEPFPAPVSVNPPMANGGGAQRNAVPIYRVPNLRVTLRTITDMPLRGSAMRGLGAAVNVWAIESAMEELAELAGEDALAFRLRHLDDPRAADVLRTAAEMAGWGRALPEGHGIGLGFARYKGTGGYSAVAAEVVAEEVVRVRRIWVAADLGEVVNPDGAANQLEGTAIHAASQALKERVRFDRRRVTSDSWEAYPILRFSEVPAVEVRLMERAGEPWLGAGEPAFGPTIAAIANAIHAALGVRPRAMPFTPENLAVAGDGA
mgnify:CR=1 FL=1